MKNAETPTNEVHHQALYRIHRPESFKDVIGQDSLVQALEEQIKTGTVGHAYLFAGSQGLGKTSVARIFARALGTSSKDLYEIDAASNNSVDDIRALTENVYTLPFESRYKVYILDEAHMLSKGAWNAFLKTLEEPPAHALFILATTELEKVPETVQSRCQVFQLKKPTRALLKKVVTDVAKKEGITIEPEAAELVALLADGSYRDALSVLQKVCSTAVGEEISLVEAEKALGAPRRTQVQSLLSAISAGSLPEGLETLSKLVLESVDIQTYTTLVLEDMRNVLLLRHAPELRKGIEEESGADHFAELLKIAENKESKLTHNTLRVFLDAVDRLRFSPVPVLSLELALYELFSTD